MQKRKLVISLFILALCFLPLNQIKAQTISSLSLHGVGITVELTYPEEAHPGDYIDHNITINSQINPYLQVFNFTIYQEIDQAYYEITNLALFNWGILTDPLTRRINVTIPAETLGRLYCSLYINIINGYLL